MGVQSLKQTQSQSQSNILKNEVGICAHQNSNHITSGWGWCHGRWLLQDSPGVSLPDLLQQCIRSLESLTSKAMWHHCGNNGIIPSSNVGNATRPMQSSRPCRRRSSSSRGSMVQNPLAAMCAASVPEKRPWRSMPCICI